MAFDKFAGLDKFVKKYYNNEEKFDKLINHTSFIKTFGSVPDIKKMIGNVVGSRGWTDELPGLARKKKSQKEDTLQNRINQINHLDKFQPFLLYLMNIKKMDSVDVYKNSLIDRRTFSKIKSDEDYHPKKLTALCLCIGLKLNIDQAKDLLTRAGYTFSATDLTDVIFFYYIEKSIYDIDIINEALLKYNLPTITKFE